MSAIVAADIPLRAMTRMAASWMEWMRNSWTTSSFDLAAMSNALNERSVNQNSWSVVNGAAENIRERFHRRGADAVLLAGHLVAKDDVAILDHTGLRGASFSSAAEVL